MPNPSDNADMDDNLNREAKVELKDFVQNTLKEIIEGVVEAQGQAKAHGAAVSPKMGDYHWSDSGKNRPMVLEGGRVVTQVEFDVLLSQAEGTGAKGGIGVFLGAVGIGGQGDTTTSDSKMTRIRFQVPILLPVQTIEERPVAAVGSSDL